MAALSGSPLLLSSAEAERFLTEEADKWTQLLRAANIKPE
jgi:hypothetical protein